VLGVLRFWLDLGFDGLRLDGVPYLLERDGTNCEVWGELRCAAVCEPSRATVRER
jgi:maltose alpha-D-glucosyltransferase / alpha-amylase